MDLLGGYGSSSDEDQPRTAIATPPLKANPSKEEEAKEEEVWSIKFQKIKEFYEENKHLNLPRKVPEYARLYQWLTIQRRTFKSLRKDQLERLESIHYKTAKFHRDGDHKGWQVKYDQLRQLHTETGSVKINDRHHALASWLSRQKRLWRTNLLDSTCQEKLRKLGINLSTTKSHGTNKVKVKQFEEKWQAQFEKLKEYHRVKGDCNVPRNSKGDRSFGIWVSNQRRHYMQAKTGETDMDPDRIQKLEQLGFEWSRRRQGCLLQSQSQGIIFSNVAPTGRGL
jgi:post-segregation antitoxin (ccd killing protein)